MHTVKELIDERANQYGYKVFMIFPETGIRLTFKSLQTDCRNLGKYFIKLGLEKGDRVSFMMGNGCQTVKILLGAMYAGLVAGPINLIAQPSQLEHVIDHSDTKMIFFTYAERERLEKAVLATDRDVKLIRIDNDAETIVPESEKLSGITLPPVSENDPALLLYTSGTTSLPKGVLLSHKNLIAGGKNTCQAHLLTAEDRALCSLPLYHINGEVVTVMGPLISGGSVIVPHKFSASHFWELLLKYKCTWFSVVPTILSYLDASSEIKGKDLNLDQLRFGRSASAPLPPALHRAFEEKFGVPIIETMGLTETAAPIASNPLDLEMRKFGSIGIPVGNEIKIVGPDGNTLPAGTEGEIMVRGDNVMLGYHNQPEIMAQAFAPEGWLYTGDLGYFDEVGFIFVTGRIKELIIKGGENVSPREIDDVLYKHRAILDSATLGVADEYYTEDILCCVVLKPGCTATEDELRIFCRKQLGEFKTPKRIVIMDDLPKGPSGKIQRKKLGKIVQEKNLHQL